MAEVNKGRPLSYTSQDSLSDSCFVSAKQSPEPSVKSSRSTASLAQVKTRVEEYEELEVPDSVDEPILNVTVSRSSIGAEDPREPLKVIDLVATPIVRSVFAQEDPREPLTIADIEVANPEIIPHVPVAKGLTEPVESVEVTTPHRDTLQGSLPGSEARELAPLGVASENPGEPAAQNSVDKEDDPRALPQALETACSASKEAVSQGTPQANFPQGEEPLPLAHGGKPQGKEPDGVEFKGVDPELAPLPTLIPSTYNGSGPDQPCSSSASEDDALPSPISPHATRSETGASTLTQEKPYDRVSQLQLREMPPLRRKRSSLSRLYITFKGKVKTTIVGRQGEADLYKAELGSRRESPPLRPLAPPYDPLNRTAAPRLARVTFASTRRRGFGKLSPQPPALSSLNATSGVRALTARPAGFFIPGI
ncbi:hypothetical protein L0F63_004701 [Massospora cicadina]|nr:hypothetical protein L0F63_004701 [Massospora cicadina]